MKSQKVHNIPKCFIFLLFWYILLYPAEPAHNPKVLGSNPSPATNKNKGLRSSRSPFFFLRYRYVTKINFEFISLG